MFVSMTRRDSARLSLEQLEDRASPSNVEMLASPFLGVGDPHLGLLPSSLLGSEEARSAAPISSEPVAQSALVEAPGGRQDSSEPASGQMSRPGEGLQPLAVAVTSQTVLVELVQGGGGGRIQGPDGSPEIIDFWPEQSGPPNHYIFHGVVIGTGLLDQPVYLSGLPTLDGPPQQIAYIVLGNPGEFAFSLDINLTASDRGIAEAITQDTSGRWSNIAQTNV